MPALPVVGKDSKKRKRASSKSIQPDGGDSEKSDQDVTDQCANVHLLESRILESRKHYNDIAALLTLFGRPSSPRKLRESIILSLCRIFSSLMATGRMTKTKSTTDNEVLITKWLRKRYSEFIGVLLEELREETSTRQVRLKVKPKSSPEAQTEVGHGPGIAFAITKGRRKSSTRGWRIKLSNKITRSYNPLPSSFEKGITSPPRICHRLCQRVRRHSVLHVFEDTVRCSPSTCFNANRDTETLLQIILPRLKTQS